MSVGALINPTKTIAAIATPIGRGGLGIVRLSGARAIAIADQVFRGRSTGTLSDADGFTVHYGHAHDPVDGQRIDEVLATVFRKPHSYSGEDMVEISTHGGPVVMRRILAVLIAQGAQMAQPGEFTLRAFLNGRIDLTEAEAVADLIDAKTDEAAAAAMEQLHGSLHEEIVALRAELVGALARLEMGIDFTEEDLPPEELDSVSNRLRAVDRRIDHLLAGYQRGRILRDGFVVALAGPPNVGKSTLFNRLAQDDRAIVTEIPGTTRDILREYINLDGWPVCLIDTAGIREAYDLVERIGVERTHGAIHSADGAIWLVDATTDWSAQKPPAPFSDLPIPWMIAVNKLDLSRDPSSVVREVAAHQAPTFKRVPSVVGMSAMTGDGVETAIGIITKWIGETEMTDQSARISINDRHRAAFLRAKDCVAQSLHAIVDDHAPELAAFETRNAAVALGEIIGETTTEDVLSEVFAKFCIGK
jgi:tRNA modification GTPase